MICCKKKKNIKIYFLKGEKKKKKAWGKKKKKACGKKKKNEIVQKFSNFR